MGNSQILSKILNNELSTLGPFAHISFKLKPQNFIDKLNTILMDVYKESSFNTSMCGI